MRRQNEVRHISVFINRPPQAVHEFASKPENLPKWATGLGGNNDLTILRDLLEKTAS